MAGKGSGAGFDYEEEMSGLVALRLCNEPSIQDFKLSMNHRAVKALDDIIFNYKVLGEKPVTVYVQLKQFESNVKKIQKTAFEKEKDNFSLFKYYDAFKDVTNKNRIWSDIDKDNEIFVLYTNAEIDADKFKSVEMFEKGGSPTAVTVKLQTGDAPLYQKLLSTGSDGKVYGFTVTSDESPVDKRKFFDSLLLFDNQSSVKYLKYMIRDCVQTMLGQRGDDIKLKNTASNYINYIKHRKNSTEKKPFTREEIISRVIWCYTESLHIAPKSVFTLPDSDVEAWNKLTEDKQLIVVSEFKAGYVDMLQFCISINKNKYLCLNLMHLQLDDQNVLKYLSETWPFDKINPYQTLLLICEETVNVQQKQFLQNVINALVNNQLHKLIIVCKNIDDIVSNISVNVKKLCSLNDLDSDNFLMKKPVTYYGASTTLGDFVEKYPGVDSYFKTHHLLDLCLSDLNIGTTPCYDLDFYIERKSTMSVLKPTILECKNIKNCIVCISGDFDASDLNSISYVEAESVTDESSLENCHFITIPYDDSTLGHFLAFRKLRDQLPTLQLILVMVDNEDNGTVWKIVVASDAAKTLLVEHIYERDFTLKVKNDITLLTGEPGMGKTTFCQHMWQKNVANLVPTFIIPHGDLENLRNLKQLIDCYLKNNSDLTRDIFDYQRSNKNVLFILDAFDELDKTARINALRVLKEWVNNNYSMLITSRPVTAPILERETSINSQRLSAFNTQQQIHFFKEYYTRTLKLTEVSDKIDEFTSRLLEVVHDSVNDKERLITGVPLQCRMLGEIYERQCRMYIESSEVLDNLLPKKLNIVDMYEQCIEKKFEIFCSDKMKFTRKANETLKDDIVKIYMEICQKYSLVIIFSDYAKLLKKLEKFLTESKDNSKLFSSGIFTTSEERIVKNKKVEIPIFVHRTYAEYFAALFLSENWEYENELVNLILNSREYDTVRYFFDLIVAKDCPLITATIRNDKNQIKNEIANIDETDECGRCALHLVALWGVRLTDLDVDGKYTIYNNEDICHLLLEHGLDADCKDDINEWKPIRYADNLRTLHILNALLKHSSVNDEDVPLLINDLGSNTYTNHDTYQLVDTGYRHNTLIHSVSSWGFTEVIRYLLSKVSVEELKVDSLVNSFNQTPLHLAVNKGHIDIVRLCLTIPSILHVADKSFGDRVLHYSAIKGFVEVTKLLLDNDQIRADIDCVNNSKETALQLAVGKGHADVVKLLLEAGAKFDTIDDEGYTMLHSAAYAGSRAVVDLLLSKQQVRDNLNCLNRRKCTPMQLACRNGHIDVVKSLLMAGADRYVVDKFGFTALHSAAQNGHADIVELLLEDEEIKRSINSLTVEKDTALHLAVKKNSLDTVKILLAAGATIHDADDISGDTPLITAFRKMSHEIIKLLLSDSQIKDSINVANKIQDTALHLAAEEGYVDIVDGVLAADADVNAVNKLGNTPVFSALLKGRTAVVQCLLKNPEVKKNINHVNKNGQTILHLALTKKDNDVINTLLNVCEDVNFADKNGMTPLHCAARTGESSTIKLLLGYDKIRDNINSLNIKRRTPLHLAVGQSQVGAIAELLAAGADVTIVDIHGENVLHLAGRNGNPKVVRLLLENDQIKTNANCKNKYGQTALHIAASKGRLEAVKLLLNVGENLLTTCNNGNTSLHFAAGNGRAAVAKLLCNYENVNSLNKFKQTPLHSVAMHGDNCVEWIYGPNCSHNLGLCYVVKLLLRNGSDVNLTDRKGETALQVAVKEFMADNVVQILTNPDERMVDEDSDADDVLEVDSDENEFFDSDNDWSLSL